MNIPLLTETSIESLKLIKEEAEKNLSKIHDVEDNITAKSSSFLRIIISLFVLTTGFSVNGISNSKYDVLFYFSVSLSVLFFFLVVLLQFIMFPKSTTAIGAEPNKIVTKDFIKADEFDENRIIANRIVCLQNDITISLGSYRSRLSLYKLTNAILIIGLFAIILSFTLFHLFPCAC